MGLIVMISLLFLILPSFCWTQEGVVHINEQPPTVKSSGLYSIEGKIFPAPNVSISSSWFTATRIIVNYGQFLGFMK